MPKTFFRANNENGYEPLLGVTLVCNISEDICTLQNHSSYISLLENALKHFLKSLYVSWLAEDRVLGGLTKKGN